MLGLEAYSNRGRKKVKKGGEPMQLQLVINSMIVWLQGTIEFVRRSEE